MTTPPSWHTFSFLGVFCWAAVENTVFLGVPGLGFVELGAPRYTNSY